MVVIDGAKIFIKNTTLNKYLLYLRDNKPTIPSPNMRDLFGGGIEPGEDALQAVTREINEEIGIKIYDIQKICSKGNSHTVEGQTFHITAHYFVGRTLVGDATDIILHEGKELAFFSVDEILNMDNVVPRAKELIGEAESILSSMPKLSG